MYTNEALYFATTLILVDDDAGFLQILSSKLSKNFLVKTFHCPKEAIAYLRDSRSHFDMLSPSVLVDEELEYGERYLSASKMKKLAENVQRHKLPAVIVSDYSMPEMNGIEFFEAIADMPVMKILLTGNADLDLALHAFNRSIVNKFLVKKSPQLLFDVEKNIIDCQHSFFAKASFPILNSLHLPEDSLLRQNSWIHQLEDVIRQQDVIEYYLIDNIGSYLFINRTGKKIYFICIVDRQFVEYEDIAITSRAPVEIINQLHQRTHAPVFISEEHYRLSPKDWGKILYPFEKRDGYYFSVVEK